VASISERRFAGACGALPVDEDVQGGGFDGGDTGEVDVDAEDVALHRGLDRVEELGRRVDVDVTYNYESQPCPIDAHGGVEQTAHPLVSDPSLPALEWLLSAQQAPEG
jgi:hypothetical protein